MNLDKAGPELLMFVIESRGKGAAPLLVLVEECSIESFISLRAAGFTMTFPSPVGNFVGGYASINNLQRINELSCVVSFELMSEKVVAAQTPLSMQTLF